MISGRNSERIKLEAQRLGFFYCGIAKAEKLEEDEPRLETWLKKGMHGSMQYMENHFDKRLDPRLLVEDTKSVITLLVNYFPKEHQELGIPKIAKYAYGEDYHIVVREKLNELYHFIQQEIGEVHGRGFVDSAPVLERSWAVKSGAGWIGKNGNLISKQQGSFFFIATLMVDIVLDYDDPIIKDYCGTCTKCIDACPTEAILPNKEINGSQCISYFTIELKDAVIQPDKIWKDWIFGCDICQDVCPWNRFSKEINGNDFKPIPEILHFTKENWLKLNEEAFKTIFKHSPLKRSKWSGIQRNINFIEFE